MKKILLLTGLAFASFSTISCSDDRTEYQDYDTIGSVLDVRATFDASNNYSRTFTFNNPIPSTDMILVYKGGDNGMWKLLPLTQYIGTTGNWVNYENHFSKNQVTIEANSNLAFTEPVLSSYLVDQRFRVLIIPANTVSKGNAVDYTNYNEVIKHFNINKIIFKFIFLGMQI